MKMTKKHVRMASYASLGIASCALIALCITRTFGVQEYSILIDNRIASPARTELAAFIQTLPHGLCVGRYESSCRIQKEFPWIKSVVLHRLPSHAMRVRVVIDEPRVKVNDAIITEQQREIPATVFDDTSIASIPSVTVGFSGEFEHKLPESFIPHAHTFASELFTPYSLTWIDEYQARLIDKEQPRFAILFNAYSIPDVSMFAHCASIKKQLEERGSFGGRHKTTRWVADIRFDHQVVLFSEKGGMKHG